MRHYISEGMAQIRQFYDKTDNSFVYQQYKFMIKLLIFKLSLKQISCLDGNSAIHLQQCQVFGTQFKRNVQCTYLI